MPFRTQDPDLCCLHRRVEWWKPDHLHDLVHVFLVGFVLHRSCITVRQTQDLHDLDGDLSGVYTTVGQSNYYDGEGENGERCVYGKIPTVYF